MTMTILQLGLGGCGDVLVGANQQFCVLNCHITSVGKYNRSTDIQEIVRVEELRRVGVIPGSVQEMGSYY
jgi:hypothetical protein